MGEYSAQKHWSTEPEGSGATASFRAGRRGNLEMHDWLGGGGVSLRLAGPPFQGEVIGVCRFLDQHCP